jgi:hypothetical protein
MDVSNKVKIIKQTADITNLAWIQKFSDWNHEGMEATTMLIFFAITFRQMYVYYPEDKCLFSML